MFLPKVTDLFTALSDSLQKDLKMMKNKIKAAENRYTREWYTKRHSELKATSEVITLGKVDLSKRVQTFIAVK